MSPDAINAAFELGGALLIWANVRALYRAKEVRGVYAPVMAFYAAWGLWNVFYYPAIGQTLSFWAGLGVVAGNVAWCALAWRLRAAPESQAATVRRVSCCDPDTCGASRGTYDPPCRTCDWL